MPDFASLTLSAIPPQPWDPEAASPTSGYESEEEVGVCADARRPRFPVPAGAWRATSDDIAHDRRYGHRDGGRFRGAGQDCLYRGHGNNMFSLAHIFVRRLDQGNDTRGALVLAIIESTPEAEQGSGSPPLENRLHVADRVSQLLAFYIARDSESAVMHRQFTRGVLPTHPCAVYVAALREVIDEDGPATN